jgi:hypothetical protein
VRWASVTHTANSRLAIALSVLGVALALAACGSSKPKATAGPYGPKTSPFTVSKCMHSNGVPNFPDPVSGPGGEGFHGLVVTGPGAMTVNGISFAGPAFRSAEKACAAYLPPGGPGPAVSESQKVAALAHAACIRKHGMPNFPDPTFPTGGGIALNFGPGINPQSPAFQKAQIACGGGGFREGG